jgi:hypothetical protein
MQKTGPRASNGPKEQRLAVTYAACGLVVVALGIGSRRFGVYLPSFLAEYAGDTLWALMVFLFFSALAPAVKLSRRGGAALAFAFAVEVSQLYHAPWIDGLRSTLIGGLVLGHGFLWSDLICYTFGILAGVVGARKLRAHYETESEK